MHVITRKALIEFGKRYPAAVTPLAVWYRTMKVKRYKDAHEVKTDFPQTDFLGDSLTVFDIGGNKFRLVVNIRYRRGKVYIRHLLTHAEYDKLSKAGRL
jgi:mRNA interferase HigB